MSLIVFINEVVFTAVEGLIYLLLFLVIIDKKQFVKARKFSSFITISMYTAICYWFNTYLPGVHTIGIMIFSIMLMSVVTKTNLYASTIAYLISSVFMVIIELLVIVVQIFVLEIDLKILINVPEYKLVALIFIRGIQLILVGIVFNKSILKINLSIFKKENFTIAFPFFEIGLIMVFMVSFSYAMESKVNIPVFHGVFLIIILLLIVMNIMDYRERDHMFKIKSKFENQQQYVKNMETVVDLIRKEKHDFLNHLNAISGLCKLGRGDALKKVEEYLERVTDNYQSSYTFYCTGSDYVDGLLVVKSNYAHEQEITLDVDFDVSLSEADIDDSDLISIISNIVDNAFEALILDQKPNNRILSILTYAENSKFYISISNNGPEIPEKYILKVFDDKFSTKTAEKNDRGYGLYIVDQLIKRNGGNITVSSNQGHTEFLIKLNRKIIVKNKTA